MDKREQLREIIKYQIEGYGGKINPKDDFNGFIFDILNLFPEPSVDEIAEVIQNTIEETVTKDKSIYNKDELFEVLGKIKLVETLALALSKLRIKGEGEEDKEIYPCGDCGKMRSKNEGGTVFAVCDECWNEAYKKNL